MTVAIREEGASPDVTYIVPSRNSPLIFQVSIPDSRREIQFPPSLCFVTQQGTDDAQLFRNTVQ